MAVGTLPTDHVASDSRQSSESDVVHDHIRLGKHQIVAVALIGIRIRTWHVKHAGTAEGGEAVGGSPGSGELHSARGSTKMISDGGSDANRKSLIKRIGENLLPTAQALAHAVPIDHQLAKREPRRLLSNSTLIADSLGWKATRSDAHQIIRDAWNTFEPRTALAT